MTEMASAAELAPQEREGLLSRLDPLTARGLKARLLAIAGLLALSALPMLLLAPLFEAPFDPDQGGYATIARGWLHGAIPYRDLWDNKGPLLFLWYVASFRWLGETIVAPRVMAGLAAGLSVPFVWATARALFGRREAVLAAAIFSLSFANVYLQVTANAEVFMLPPLTAGLLAFALGAKGGRLWWFLAAGILTALAVFTRQSALWAFVSYGAWLGALFIRHPEERPQHVKALACLLAGAAVGVGPIVAYFAAHGALYDLWYAMFAFNWEWAGEFPLWMKLVPPMLMNPAPLVGGLPFWALAAVGVWQLWKRGDRFAWLVLSFLAFSEVSAQTLGKTSPHYSIQLLPAAAVAAAVGVPHVAEHWQRGDRKVRALAVAATALALGTIVFAYAQPTPADRFRVQYTYRDYADDAVEAPEIASAVKELTRPGDYVYEWGRKSEIYFLAGRQPASRWLHDRPYSVDKSILDEVIADLEEKRPALIFITLQEHQMGSGGYTLPAALKEHLDEHYRYAGRVKYADLYQREER